MLIENALAMYNMVLSPPCGMATERYLYQKDELPYIVPSPLCGMVTATCLCGHAALHAVPSPLRGMETRTPLQWVFHLHVLSPLGGMTISG